MKKIFTSIITVLISVSSSAIINQSTTFAACLEGANTVLYETEEECLAAEAAAEEERQQNIQDFTEALEESEANGTPLPGSGTSITEGDSITPPADPELRGGDIIERMENNSGNNSESNSTNNESSSNQPSNRLEITEIPDPNDPTLKETIIDVTDVFTLPDGSPTDRFLQEGENEEAPIIQFFLSIIEFATQIIGSIAVILFIVAGFMFMVSQGNEQGLSQAKEVVKYAVIGLAVTFFSYVIVLFIQSVFNQ